MERNRLGPPEWLLDALDPLHLGRFVMRSQVRAVLAWAAVSVSAAVAFYLAWTGYDHPERPDGNIGHIYIDFAGQWLMGRMLVRGEGQYLYNRPHLQQALRDAYPPADADAMFSQLIESEDHPGVGGPLYPPVQALFFYPLGLLPPQPAYRIAQIANFSLTFIIGFIVWKLTRGRMWPSVAAGAVMAFPGYAGATCLGQNSLLSLAILVLGWLLTARGRPWLGGAVWGLLAFKPVWAASFFLVPLLMRRWRMCAGMALTGLVLILLTLPFVGWQVWMDWLTVGQAASRHYMTDEPWIFLSRDLQGVPRRYLLTFDPDGRATNPDRPLPNLIGQVSWLTVVGLTVLVALWRWRRPAGIDGPPAAFLMLGAWLGCYHFMYYDTLLAALPVCLLFTEPARWWLRNPLPLALLALLFGLPHLADGIDYLLTGGHPTFHSPPFDTLCLLALWAWCGWRWLRVPYQPDAQLRAEVQPSARAAFG